MVKMLSSTPFSPRPSNFLRYLVVAMFVIFLFYYMRHTTSPTPVVHRPLSVSPLQPVGFTYDGPSAQDDEIEAQDEPVQTNPTHSRPNTQKSHPIDKLIHDAQQGFVELASKESTTLEQAAAAYRKRRGRHPPPGFGRWYKFARRHKSVMIEDFFDQIHHDIEPFWGLDPKKLRRDAGEFEMTISIRNGVASTTSDWFWTLKWLSMIERIQHELPDMDIALNAMDEPRLVVPWENIAKYMAKAARTKRLPDEATVIDDFQKLPDPAIAKQRGLAHPPEWEETMPYWPVARRGCDPHSPARTTPLQGAFRNPPLISTDNAQPHLYRGYVSNFTMSNELCHQPDLQGLEGIFIEPLSTSATKSMFPMFGGSKLSVNNEILLPPPMYWDGEERFTGGGRRGAPWSSKKNTAIWRGVATGGRTRESNWRGFQRHRFVAMTNATKVSLVESGRHEPENFALPEDQYELQSQQDHRLGQWIGEWSDIGFVHIPCNPPQDNDRCHFTDFYFDLVDGVTMSQQFDSKYLPDIDGNSYSGRYLGFLRSTSLPIKATLWREWHDSRLVPWKHFVPMDNRFSDLYGIMEYFVGYQGQGGHDAAAEKIALDGSKWADRVLRKDDMLVYVYRLLLEYARVLDDRRLSMGWVDDLRSTPLHKE
ncbi:hypothetical protein CDD82_4528 [Ophiocordyceps australis]|uniref:Glycosyl transferase CAP10 domain-containing protein n=1 Tax=Ophiocordyceps australis TaxID=1399860 RepID=A0A2C5Z095_9HYPO|nr:hypothetical protein CDD82_4528 [Ophiocordyceps australis]